MEQRSRRRKRDEDLCAELWKSLQNSRDAAGLKQLKKADAALLIGDPALSLSLTMGAVRTRIEDHGPEDATKSHKSAGWISGCGKDGVVLLSLQ